MSTVFLISACAWLTDRWMWMIHWTTASSSRQQYHPKTLALLAIKIHLLTSLFVVQISEFCVSELSNMHTKFSFHLIATHQRQALDPILCPKPYFRKTADTIHCRWTFHVFSVCDFQSDCGPITATLLLLIPSDPLSPSLLIRFLWLGYLSSPALTVSDAWLMGLAFKSAGLMRQNPNKGCHSCGGSSFRVP